MKLQGSDSLLVGSIYHSPSSPLSTSVSSLCNLFTELSNYIYSFINLWGTLVSWSDLPVPPLIAMSNLFLTQYIDDLFLFQHNITEPTRIRQDESPSLLDLVFTIEQDMINNLSYYIYLPPLDNSDHICIQFDILCYSEPKKTDNIKYNNRAANINLMKQILSDIDLVSILDPLNTNDAWLQFKSIFSGCL